MRTEFKKYHPKRSIKRKVSRSVIVHSFILLSNSSWGREVFTIWKIMKDKTIPPKFLDELGYPDVWNPKYRSQHRNDNLKALKDE